MGSIEKEAKATVARGGMGNPEFLCRKGLNESSLSSDVLESFATKNVVVDSDKDMVTYILEKGWAELEAIQGMPLDGGGVLRVKINGQSAGFGSISPLRGKWSDGETIAHNDKEIRQNVRRSETDSRLAGYGKGWRGF